MAAACNCCRCEQLGRLCRPCDDAPWTPLLSPLTHTHTPYTIHSHAHATTNAATNTHTHTQNLQINRPTSEPYPHTITLTMTESYASPEAAVLTQLFSKLVADRLSGGQGRGGIFDAFGGRQSMASNRRSAVFSK